MFEKITMPQVRSMVQINTRDQRGGAERVAWNLFQAYQQRGRASWLMVGKNIAVTRRSGKLPTRPMPRPSGRAHGCGGVKRLAPSAGAGAKG